MCFRFGAWYTQPHAAHHLVIASCCIVVWYNRASCPNLACCPAGEEEPALQTRIERFLQEAFQPGQAFGGNSGGASPPPGQTQSLTPIPRDSSLARAVLTGLCLCHIACPCHLAYIALFTPFQRMHRLNSALFLRALCCSVVESAHDFSDRPTPLIKTGESIV